MYDKIKRGIGSILTFLVIWFLADFIIGTPTYDMYVKSIEYLAAVIGAGCYWIGSKNS